MLLQVRDVLPQGFTETAQLGGPLVRPVSARTITKRGDETGYESDTGNEQQCYYPGSSSRWGKTYNNHSPSITTMDHAQ